MATSLQCSLSVFHPAFSQTTVDFFTSGTSWTVPNNWNNSNDTAQVIGSGGEHKSSPSIIIGNGVGSYGKVNSLSLTLRRPKAYQVGVSAAPSMTSGGATWFNGAKHIERLLSSGSVIV
jgi:hypothetical protein